MSFLHLFEDNYGHKHYLTKEISRGGQGVVFRTTDQNIAVKVCLDEYGEPLRDDTKNEKYNKIRLLPFPKGLNLTLPQAVLKGASGYVMTLLEDMSSFASLFSKDKYQPTENEWLKLIAETNPECAKDFGRYITSGGARRRLEMYLRFAALLSSLHCAGLVYCDISTKNVFGSSDTDKFNVWLIDSDNINYQAITVKGNNTFYTQGCAAPELIEQGEASMYSDCYAFAICFFEDLTMSHPFKGKMYDEMLGDNSDAADNAEKQVFSGNEPWIYDTENRSNCGQSAIPAEFVLNGEMMALLQRMFSEESRLSNILCRPTMPIIAEEIARLTDITVRCERCGMDSVYSESCPWCNTKQQVIKLTSYRSENGKKRRKLWQFIRECPEDLRISVPERMITGFLPNSLDKTAFSATAKNDGYYLSDFSPRTAQTTVYVKEADADYKEVRGSYISVNDCFTIKIENNYDNTAIIIEGSVVN